LMVLFIRIMSSDSSVTLGEEDTASEEEETDEETESEDGEEDTASEDEYEAAWADIHREDEWRRFYGKRKGVLEALYDGEDEEDLPDDLKKAKM
jgi:hypothetical protein